MKLPNYADIPAEKSVVEQKREEEKLVSSNTSSIRLV
jgi:hypothetical protein